MATTYEQITARAEAATARKREQNDAFISTRTFRENSKQSSQYSDDNHQTPVDDYGGKVQDSLRTRTTEHEALKVAGGLSEYPEQPPLIDRPNKYANLKRCSCKEHEGDKWVNRSLFSADPRHVDGLKSQCKRCMAAQRRFAYVPRWRRGV